MAKSGSLLAQLLAAKAPLPPEAVAPPPSTAPEIDDFYMRAFSDLSTCRDLGMGVGPIPWLAIDRYAERAGLDRPATSAFVTVLRALDAKYLEIKRDEKAGPS